MHRIQNVSLTQRPDDALKMALCGYIGKPLLAYELRSQAVPRGRYFYLDPSNGGFHLRSVVSTTTPFDQAQS